MGRAYGINIVVDPEIRTEETTVDLRNLSFLKALDTMMVVNRHFFKVVDDNTIIIMKDNNNTRERYENQVIRTFYLSNITPNDLKSHLRQLGGLKEFAENERLNSITVKGTPEKVALVEKIIRDNDKAKPEVVIEIELLEVNKNKMRQIGIVPVDSSGAPRYTFGITADPVGRADNDADQGGIRGIFPDLDNEDFLTIVPSLAVDFLKDSGDSTQVANPHLRVTSGEKGSIRIGQSVPVVNTAFTNANISGSATDSSAFGDSALTTFNYREVGISINVTPRVHFDGDVTLELELEISSVLSGGFQPTFGERRVTTSLRLANGEMNVLAGLLTEDERRSLSGIAGLSDIPILGKLFTHDEKVISKTDIVMTIRPVIIRGTDIREEDTAAYELSSLTLSSLYGAPEDGEAESTAPEPIPAPREPGSLPDRSEPIDVPDAAVTAPEDTGEAMVAEDNAEMSETEPLPAMVAFSPTNSEARRDDLVEVQVFVTNVEDLSRGELTVTFDPELLQAEAVALGDFFGGRRPTLTPAWNNNVGTVSMVITQRLGGASFSGMGALATIRFRAKQAGSGILELRNPVLEKEDGSAIAVESLPASVEVYP